MNIKLLVKETIILFVYRRKLAGAVIALCCHHRCVWKPYVGKNFFKQCGLSARDFQIMSSMSSWATCAWKGWSHQKKVKGQNSKAADSLTNNDDIKNAEERNDDSKSNIADLDADIGENSRKTVPDVDSSYGNKGSEVKVSSSSQGQAVDIDDEEEEEHDQDENTTNTGLVSFLSKNHMDNCRCILQQLYFLTILYISWCESEKGLSVCK